MPRLRPVVAAASLAVAAAVTGIALSTGAQAAETDDPRAVAHDGNATTCAAAGLSGDLVDKSDLEFTGGVVDSDTSVTITGVADGLDVTGIVVKGGDAYNVYEPGARGLSADVPWADLVAPINNGGQQPQLSHWYVCAEETEEPPTSSTPPSSTEPTEPTETSEPTGTTEPSETTGPSQPGDDTTTPTSDADSTTTTSDAAASSDDDDLALTGFGAGWLIPIGALLLLGGGLAMWLARQRKRA